MTKLLAWGVLLACAWFSVPARASTSANEAIETFYRELPPGIYSNSRCRVTVAYAGDTPDQLRLSVERTLKGRTTRFDIGAKDRVLSASFKKDFEIAVRDSRGGLQTLWVQRTPGDVVQHRIEFRRDGTECGALTRDDSDPDGPAALAQPKKKSAPKARKKKPSPSVEDEGSWMDPDGPGARSDHQ